jgi:hypothetical protein
MIEALVTWAFTTPQLRACAFARRDKATSAKPKWSGDVARADSLHIRLTERQQASSITPQECSESLGSCVNGLTTLSVRTEDSACAR